MEHDRERSQETVGLVRHKLAVGVEERRIGLVAGEGRSLVAVRTPVVVVVEIALEVVPRRLVAEEDSHDLVDHMRLVEGRPGVKVDCIQVDGTDSLVGAVLAGEVRNLAVEGKASYHAV